MTALVLLNSIGSSAIASAASGRPEVTVRKVPGKSKEITFRAPGHKGKSRHNEGTLTMRAPSEYIDKSKLSKLRPGEHFGDKAYRSSDYSTASTADVSVDVPPEPAPPRNLTVAPTYRRRW